MRSDRIRPIGRRAHRCAFDGVQQRYPPSCDLPARRTKERHFLGWNHAIRCPTLPTDPRFDRQFRLPIRFDQRTPSASLRIQQPLPKTIRSPRNAILRTEPRRKLGRNPRTPLPPLLPGCPIPPRVQEQADQSTPVIFKVRRSSHRTETRTKVQSNLRKLHSSAAGSFERIWFVSGVRTNPGAMALTRIRRGASATHNDRTIAARAPLEVS